MRISTTTIEAFRRVVTCEYADEQELIANIQGKPFEPSWQMLVGRAWTEVLENPNRNFEVEACHFDHDDIETALGVFPVGSLPEVKAVVPVRVDGMIIDLVAKVDRIYGTWIHETKAKFSTVSAADYEPDLQWRLYLWALEAHVCTYHCFRMKNPDDDGFVQLVGHERFSFWRYQGLEADCMTWLRRFLEWADSRKLLPFLEREGTPV